MEAMERLPREIGKLINLRYLSLRNTGISVLPLSMRYLQSLQTLDIRDVGFKEIPNVISKLENLQHLHMDWLWMLVGQLKIDTLRHLQIVSGINVSNWKGNNSKLLRNIWKMEVVVEESCTDGDLLEFFNSITDLENLSSLQIQFSEIFIQSPSLSGGLSSLHHLTKLSIDAWDTWFPREISMHEFPQNLFQLTLSGFFLDEIHMEVLGNLPKLSILRLRDAFRQNSSQLSSLLKGRSSWGMLLASAYKATSLLRVVSSNLLPLFNGKVGKALHDNLKLLSSKYHPEPAEIVRFLDLDKVFPLTLSPPIVAVLQLVY